MVFAPARIWKRKHDWFDAGEAVCNGCTDSTCYPPIEDPHARQLWLCGFAAAWSEMNTPDRPSMTRSAQIRALCRNDLGLALMQALRGREALAAQLLFEMQAQTRDETVH